jgi:hypothetical protein
MDPASILSIVAIVTSVGGAVIGLINHTRVKSICCGKKLEVSLDISKTSSSPGVEESKYQTGLGAEQRVPPEALQSVLKISIPPRT